MPEPADDARTTATTAGSTTTPPPLRASDADRAATVHALQDAVTRGLLTTEEGSDRMAAAFAAVHLADLPPLTADLPPAAAPRATPPGWRPLAALAMEQVKTSVGNVRAGRVTPARLAAAIAVTMLIVVALGFLVGGLFDGGPEFHDFHDLHHG
jgi:hypothetical protein